MRLLLVNTDYRPFLDELYHERPGLAAAGYDEQLRVRNESLFGVADFYSRHLRALGHEAWDVHANNRPLQLAWAREHGLRLPSAGPLGFLPRRRRRAWARRWLPYVLRAQIEHHRPDVVFNMDPAGLAPRLFRELDPAPRLLVGQHASPLPEGIDLSGYDLMTSSLPNLVERFRALGLRAELHRLGFEPAVLEALGPAERPTVEVSFVGTVSTHHADRVRWLESVCRRVPELRVWASGADDLPADSPIRRALAGRVFGRAMYEVLRASRVTLNHHIGMAGPYANNMRLYEATGAGTLLITDSKRNLPEIFDPASEVAAYRDDDHCVQLIESFLADEQARARVAAAGQARTVREHSYAQRAAELVQLVAQRL